MSDDEPIYVEVDLEASGPTDKWGKKAEWDTPTVAKAKPKGKGIRLVQIDYSQRDASY